jgi:hypothetical protein
MKRGDSAIVFYQKRLVIEKLGGFNVSALGTMTFSELLPVNLCDGCVMNYADQ